MCVYMSIYTHTYIYIHSLEFRFRSKSIAQWVGKKPTGFTGLIGNPAGPGFAAIASDTPVFMDS